MKYSVAILLALTLIFGGWYAASPYYSLSGLRDAAAAGDVDGIENHVNFPALRNSIKSEFKSKLNAQAARNPFIEAAGIALADRIMDEMLDNMMTPDGIAQMVKITKDTTEQRGNLVAKEGQNRANGKYDAWAIERVSLSEFRLSNPNDDKSPILIFQRDGLGWKLSAVDMTAVDLMGLR